MKKVQGILLEERNQEVKNALNYFGVLNQKASLSLDAGSTTFHGINNIGIVELVQLRNQKAALTGAGNDDDLNSILESLSNILVAAVLKHAGNDEKSIVSPENWRAGYNALVSLFCHNYSVDVVEYNDKAVGKAGVEEVIKIAFDVNGEPSGPLKDSIEKYLQKQGDLMNEMGFDGTLKNPYTLIGFSNFIVAEKHTCCFRAYFTNFNTNSVRIKESCKDDKLKFDFDFTVTHCNADFMLSNWLSNPTFREKVKKFIEDHQSGTSYFDDFSTGMRFRV